jgi:hypothetical protein
MQLGLTALTHEARAAINAGEHVGAALQRFGIPADSGTLRAMDYIVAAEVMVQRRVHGRSIDDPQALIRQRGFTTPWAVTRITQEAARCAVDRGEDPAAVVHRFGVTDAHFIDELHRVGSTRASSSAAPPPP